MLIIDPAEVGEARASAAPMEMLLPHRPRTGNGDDRAGRRHAVDLQLDDRRASGRPLVHPTVRWVAMALSVRDLSLLIVSFADRRLLWKPACRSNFFVGALLSTTA